MGFFTSAREKEAQENTALFNEAMDLWQSGVKDQFGAWLENADTIARENLEEHGALTPQFFDVLSSINSELVVQSGYFREPVNPNAYAHDLERMYHERDALRRTVLRWAQTDGTLDFLDNYIRSVDYVLLSLLPELPDDFEQPNKSTLSISLLDSAERLRERVGYIVTDFALIETGEIVEHYLFDSLRARVQNNLGAIGEHLKMSDVWPYPEDVGKKLTDREVVEMFLKDTPFLPFFDLQIPFSISLDARTEHTHVVGGSGHGKTQCLQYMMIDDINRAADGGGGFCIIDSQGDMIDTVSRLRVFAKGEPLENRLVIVDPNDIERPPAVNMFDVGMERFASYSAVDREKILNGSVEIYEYIFGALLGAELTSKQSVIFKFLARYMLTTPGATIHTLREFVQHGTEDSDFSRVDPLTRDFFRSQFFSRTYADTRNQVATRLWGVLSNSIFERMFSASTNKVDIFGAMNDGKIVLINTAKDLLKSDGCSIFGRFFIAMIAQASLARAAMPKEDRSHFFVYIDEAQDYFDDNIENLLNQSRKYNVGLLFAHQNLGQLTPSLKASIMASTASKFCGGVNASDATAFSKEMRCSPDFILDQKKTKTSTRFATYIKNTTPVPVSLSVPFGAMESLPRMSQQSYTDMRNINAQALGFDYTEVQEPVAPVVSESPSTSPASDSVESSQPHNKTAPPTKSTDDKERFSVDIGAAFK